MKTAWALFLVLCLCSPLAAQDVPYYGSEVVHPNQRLVVPRLTAVTAAGSDKSAVTKAAVATVLSASGVSCAPDSPLNSVVLSEATPSAGLATLARRISGISCMMNGRALRVTASFVPNGDIRASDIVASILEGRPLLLEWNANLYVLYGVICDEHVQSTGQRDYVIHALLLIDPRFSDKHRFVAFQRDQHNFAEVAGLASVTALPR